MTYLRIRVGASLEEVKRRVVLATLKRFNGHRRNTMLALGITDKTLYNMLKRYEEQGRKVTHGSTRQAHGTRTDGTRAGWLHPSKASRRGSQAVGVPHLLSQRWGKEPQDHDRSAGGTDE